MTAASGETGFSKLLQGSASMAIADRFFYHPRSTIYESPDDYNLSYESVSFSHPAGPKLCGWFFPADGQPAGTVLHLHGNAGNITGHFTHASWLASAGWNVLCFDYRGYGQSEGRISRRGSIEDAHAAVDYLLTRDDVDPAKLVVFGQSLGGAIGIVLTASRQEIAGIVTDGAFSHYRRTASWHLRHNNPMLWLVGFWVPPTLMSANYEPIDAVADIAPRPLLIIHGQNDTIVPVSMAHELYERASEPKSIWVVDGADHYGPLADRPIECRQRIIEHFKQCVSPNSEPVSSS
jgi:hypothetical protein